MQPAGLPTHEVDAGKKATVLDEKASGLEVQILGADLEDGEGAPSQEELSTLRKVAAPLPLTAVCMCLIEFAERASYYGSKGPFNNCE